MKALQTINTESTILSFNEIDDKYFDDDDEYRQSSNSSSSDGSSSEHVDESTFLMVELDKNRLKKAKSKPIREEEEYHDNDDDDDDLKLENEDLESSEDDIKEDENKLTEDVEIKEIETFDGLQGSELISILYLLYLQYKPSEWEKLVKSDKDIYTQIALAKYRDQFGHLTQNVTTIRMEKSSDLIKYFFSINMDKNDDNSDSITNTEEIRNIIYRRGKFEYMKYNINFETIIKLFPKCKQISIDGDNFDWTLRDFISFLKRFNLDFSDIYLQDIFLRFKPEYSSINAQEIAKKRLKKTHRKQLTELAKLGWRFITPSHIHRFGFQPPEEKPFLVLFMTEGRVFHHSYSKRMLGTTPKMGVSQDSVAISGHTSDNFLYQQQSFFNRALTINSLRSTQSMRSSLTFNSKSIGIEGDHAIIDYNPKHLFLSQQVLDNCHYLKELTALLENRKESVYKERMSPGSPSKLRHATTGDRISLSPPGHQMSLAVSFVDEEIFDNLCKKVETLMLYPIHDDLYTIFYETFAEKKKSILELMTIKLMFPNVTDIYLRDTTFNSRICGNLISFITDHKNKNSKIKRIFYSIDKQCNSRDVAKLKLRLNVYRWDFSAIEQVAFKQELQDIV